MKKFFHTIKSPVNGKLSLIVHFPSILSWLSYKSYTEISFIQMALVLSHCKDIEVDYIRLLKSKYFT